MATYEVIPATEDHALEMAPFMRQADADEVWAAAHFTPIEALLVSLETSLDAKAGLVDGRVLCMFGVGQMSLISDTGIPWMLGSEELPDYAIAFLRRNKEYVAEISTKYRLLLNYVDARNTMSIRWLDWLGFEVEDAAPFGVEDMPFHLFRMESK